MGELKSNDTNPVQPQQLCMKLMGMQRQARLQLWRRALAEPAAHSGTMKQDLHKQQQQQQREGEEMVSPAHSLNLVKNLIRCAIVCRLAPLVLGLVHTLNLLRCVAVFDSVDARPPPPRVLPAETERWRDGAHAVPGQRGGAPAHAVDRGNLPADTREASCTNIHFLYIILSRAILLFSIQQNSSSLYSSTKSCSASTACQKTPAIRSCSRATTVSLREQPDVVCFVPQAIHVVEFRYDSAGGVLGRSSVAGQANAPSRKEISAATIDVLRSLLALGSSFQNMLPDVRHFALKLFYRAGVTPDDYKPEVRPLRTSGSTDGLVAQFFSALDIANMKSMVRSDAVCRQVGTVYTPYHQMSICVRINGDNDSVSNLSSEQDSCHTAGRPSLFHHVSVLSKRIRADELGRYKKCRSLPAVALTSQFNRC